MSKNMEYVIRIDDIMDDLFYELECVQDGVNSHQILMKATSKEHAAREICNRLIPFFEKRFLNDREK